MAKIKTKAVDAPAAPPPKETLSRSVEQSPQNLFAGPGGGNTFTFWMASIAETFTPWGTNYTKRDQELRDFFHSETFLSGAVYTSAIANSQLEWKLDGPEQTTEAVLDLLNKANLGKGWAHFAKQLSIDLYTQDNGAFVEVIRERRSPEAPVIGIQVLDAGRCQRTGDLNIPVIYTDRQGTRHKMPWYSIIAFEEFPSPIESMFNLQYCAVTRALRAAQILRDFAIYKGEKAGGRFADAIHIVGGVSTKDLEDVRKRAEEQGDNAGLSRYLGAMVMGSLDPETNPSVVTLDFKSLPDSFNLDDEMRWYISSLALAFGRDYQDFAPLPSGNLGSGQQSETLHKKGRQKASAAFMRMLEQGFNFFGVMPQTVKFEFEQQDLEEDQEVAEIAKTWAQTYKLFGEAGVIGPKIARQMLQDEGILKPEFVEALGEEDITPGHPIEGGDKPGSNGKRVPKIDETEPPEPTEKDILEAMFASLSQKAEGIVALKEYIAENAKAIAQDPVVAELSEAIRETSLILKMDLTELQSTFDRTAEDIRKDTLRRADATNAAIKSLTAALVDLEKEQKRRASVSEIRALTQKELQQTLLETEVREQSILKRDNEGRAEIVRKKFASGRIVDYKVIRGRDGKTKKMKEIKK